MIGLKELKSDVVNVAVDKKQESVSLYTPTSDVAEPNRTKG